MNVYQAILKILEDLGRTEYVFGSAGQANASFMLALRSSKKIKTIIVRNEQAASFMACDYTMFNPRNLGVCFATGGPGAFNLFQGLATANNDSLPILAITGYASKQHRGKGYLNESTGLNRTPDSQKIFSCLTKKSYIVEDAAQIYDIMEEAVTLIFDGRPGPVHIHIPKDIAIAEAPDFRQINPKFKEYPPANGVSKAAAAVFANAISNGKKPVFLVGYGCIRANAKEEIIKFVEKYNVPFVTTMDAKGYLPENHRLSAGVFGTSGDILAKEVFEAAEVVIAAGNSFAENATYSFKMDLFAGKELIHINIDKKELGKVYEPTLSVFADAGLAMQEINAQTDKLFEGKNIPQYYNILDSSKKTTNMPLEPVKTSGTIHPAEIAQIISRVAPADAIILGDAGSHMLWLSAYMQLDKNQRYQNPGSFGTMSSHTNGSIGVKCANPNKVVISGSGDGCYTMSGFELLTAVAYNIPIVWIIFNNGEFNIIKKFLLNLFDDYAYIDVPNPDYCKYAESCGAKGFRVSTAEEFEKTLKYAIELNEPVIIDAKIDNMIYPPMNL